MSNRIILKFNGGDWDGKVLDSEATDPVDKTLFEMYRDMANQPIGYGFYGVGLSLIEQMLRTGEQIRVSEAGVTGAHKYTVAEKSDDGSTVTVVLQYSPLFR